jgi:hypothetical protein
MSFLIYQWQCCGTMVEDSNYSLKLLSSLNMAAVYSEIYVFYAVYCSQALNVKFAFLEILQFPTSVSNLPLLCSGHFWTYSMAINPGVLHLYYIIGFMSYPLTFRQCSWSIMKHFTVVQVFFHCSPALLAILCLNSSSEEMILNHKYSVLCPYQ